MAADRIQEALRKIPQVDQVLSEGSLTGLVQTRGREQVVSAIRGVLDELRDQIRKTGDGPDEFNVGRLAGQVITRMQKSARPGIRRVINATGVVLHTGLGRAVLPTAAIRAIQEELKGYSTLEVERSTGERSVREAHVTNLLMEVTGAEAATVVNNNAAATMITLATLAGGREVIVSRGQLIEIGGSFRMPDVMKESGCTLVEVGATNKTHPSDFENAITEQTGLLVHVHTSNFRIVGFTREVNVEELVSIGRKARIPVLDDIGSGALVDLSKYGIRDEPTVQGSLKAGVDLVCFSGDKLLGGPQAGIIVGRRKYVERIRKHPLFRAFRPDKMALVALEATLRLYQNPDRLLEEVPTLGMLAAGPSALEAAALELARLIKDLPGLSVDVLEEESEAGGGSAPTLGLRTRVVGVASNEKNLKDLAQGLRDADPPIMARIQKDRVLFDVRTLLPGEIDEIAAALQAMLGGGTQT